MSELSNFLFVAKGNVCYLLKSINTFPCSSGWSQSYPAGKAVAEAMGRWQREWIKKRERNSHFIGKHEPRIKGQRNARDGYDVGLGLIILVLRLC